MSIQVSNAVWQHSQSQGRARLVLLAIADHQGEIGAWPSIATISRMVNASERSVQRDIQTLQELGELSVEVQNAPTRQQYKSNLYWVILPGVTEMNSGVTDSTSGVTEMASGVTAGGVRTITKPLLEKDLTSNGFEDEFLEFWNTYPRRVEKLSAKKSFIKAAQDGNLQAILEGVKRLSLDPNLPPKQFIPHPASWLNAGSWENEPYPERIKSKQEIESDNLTDRTARLEREAIQRDKERFRLANEHTEAESRRANGPPQCEHGNSVARCLTCIRNNKPKGN